MQTRALTSEEAIALETQYGATNYSPLPVVISRGKGVEVWDPEGRRYLDFLSGICSVSQGHAHPKILAALRDQSERLTLISRAFYSDVFGVYAKYITQYFGYERVLSMNTGVEAVETAIKLARKWGYEVKGVAEGKAKVIFCQDNFHGRTLGAISACPSEDSRKKFGPFLENFEIIPYNDLPALEAALKDPNAVAFVVEPIQGEGGVNVPAEGYLKKAYALCKSARALFIADEVQVGIGRTGKLIACEHEGVKPDVLVLGKALSGGILPTSAVLADTAVLGVFKPGDHGSTFGGNPLACAVAMAALEVVREEKLTENAAKMGEIFRAEMKAFKSPWIKDVRGKGLLNALEIQGTKASDLCVKLKDAGLITKNTREHIIRFAPPLIIKEAQLREGIAIIQTVLKEIPEATN